MKPLALAIFALVSLAVAPLQADDKAARKERKQKIDEGYAAFQKRDYAAASAAFERALMLDPTTGESQKFLPWLGRAYEAQNNYQRALTAYEQAREIQPRNIDRLLDLARVYDQVDLNAEAVELYKQVLKREEDRRDVLWALAVLYAKEKEWDEARAAAETYLMSEPQDREAQELMAQIQEGLGHTKEAAHIREGVLASSPTAAGFELLGNLWSRENQFELAVNAYDRAERAGARSADFWISRGVLAWRANTPEKAAAYWNKALAQEPGHLTAQFLLAVADEAAGRSKEAAVRIQKIAANGSDDNLKKWADFYMKAKQSAAPTAGEAKPVGRP